jgi:hypothetical protein
MGSVASLDILKEYTPPGEACSLARSAAGVVLHVCDGRWCSVRRHQHKHAITSLRSPLPQASRVLS